MRSWLVGAVVVAVACHHDTTPSRVPAEATSTAVEDALWAKAPDGSDLGLVVSPRGMIMAGHAWQDVHAFVKVSPELAAFEREISDVMRVMGVRDFAWSQIGVDPRKGLAVFLFDHERSAISLFGVTDRDRFVKRSLGTRGADYDRLPNMICKPVANGYYACTSGDIANLAHIGKGRLGGQLAAAKARGDVEVVIDAPPMEAAAVIQLERGAFVVRGSIAGLPSSLASWLGPVVTPHVDLEHVSGFGVVNIAPVLAQLPPTPLVGGVTIEALARAIAGPLTITASGEPSVDARVPLNDAGPAKQLVAHCLEIPGLRALGAKLEAGACRLAMPQYGFTAELRVDGNELHLVTSAGMPAAGSPTALARELARGPWHATFWGRGTVLAPHSLIPPETASANPAAAELAVRALLMIEELGIGVRLDGDRLQFVVAMRTAWSNPDDVVAKLLAVAPADVLAGRGGVVGKAIADAAPSSPFAADYRAGSTGLMLPAAAFALVAGLAAPSFTDKPPAGIGR